MNAWWLFMAIKVSQQAETATENSVQEVRQERGRVDQ
jgi:hypothetical protein